MRKPVPSFSRKRASGRRPARPRLEALEDRCVPATITVDSLSNAVGIDGRLTLREAITAANANAAFFEAPAGDPGLDEIVFAPNLLGGTIGLNAALPSITEALTITGPGSSPDGITIDGQGTFRVLNITNTASQVNLSNLTLTQGNTAGDGGGLRNFGPNTTLTNVAVSGNSSGTFGGGIRNSGRLTLNGVVVTGNSAAGVGGGIANVDDPAGTETLIVNDSTLSNNTTLSAGGGVSNSGTMTIRRSTLSGNSADNRGGGIRNVLGGAGLIEQTTIANNVTAENGGGVYTNSGVLTFRNSTIAYNVDYDAGFFTAGGISRTGGNVNLRNTIFGDNVAPAGQAQDILGLVTSQGGNLVGDSFGAAGLIASDLLNVDPLLTPLQDNGGPTLTVAPLPGSPAIDGGLDAGFPTDQRGFSRVVDGNTNGIATIDPGAVEYIPPATTTTLVAAPTMTSTLLDVMLTATVSAPAVGADVPAGTVDFFNGTSATPLNASPVPLDPAGTAQFPVNGLDLDVGDNTITAVFNPATPQVYDPSASAPQVVTIEEPTTATTVTASTGSTSTALPVTLTVTVTAAGMGVGTPSGTVDFFNGSTQLNDSPVFLDAGGMAEFTFAGLLPGTNTLTAVFTPDAGSPLPGSEGTVEVNAAVVSTIGNFDPNSGNWFLRNQNNPGNLEFGFVYGLPSWLPVVGDWDGDGTQTVGVVDPATNIFYLRNDNSSGAPDAGQFAFGLPGWLPLAGDWDGDGSAGVGAYDPATSTFYLRNSPSAGAPDLVLSFGTGGSGLIPLAGNWDGSPDGSDEVGLFDPGSATWILRASNDPLNGALLTPAFAFGAPGTRPVAGDWDGNGSDTVGVFDPSGIFGQFFLRDVNGPGAPTQNGGAGITYGLPGWLPLAGNWGPAPEMPTTLLALQAAGGVGPGAPALQADQLAGIVASALARLSAAGVDPAVVNALASAEYVIGAVPSGWLGAADVEGGRVVLSADAAGNGWFVDPTPLDDEEFGPGGPGGALTALEGTGAGGQMDLLSVVLHEMGHLAGLPDVAEEGALMGAFLTEGVRRTGALDGVFRQGV